MAKKSGIKKAVTGKIQEALAVLDALGFPRQQQNERSALTLLSLLGLKPYDTWDKASDPLMGITPMMEFFLSIMPSSMRRTLGRQYVVRPFISLFRLA